MTKQEFETHLTKGVTQEEYATIEFVYNFHPSISDTDGKKQIVGLYKIGGMRIIKDMVATAEQAEELEGKITYHRMQLEEYKRRLEDLRA